MAAGPQGPTFDFRLFDLRLFDYKLPAMRLDEIARVLDCELQGDGSIEVRRLWPIESAEPGDLCFVANPRYAQYLRNTTASAVIVSPDAEVGAVATLRTAEPYVAFTRALKLFYEPPPVADGIHPSAVIATGAHVGQGASIGPCTVIEDEVEIGRDARLGPNVTIGYGSKIGDNFAAHASAVVREFSRIGDRVTLHAGVVIGSDGFGYVPVPEGRLEKLIQSGIVRIGNDVEVGANATIDRATIGETLIGNGVKIDNLVQIGHGCSIGDHSVVASQTGLAGSSRVGSWVQLGGQVGVAGHLSIGDGARVAGRAGVTGDVEGGATVGGFPAIPVQQWRRVAVLWTRLGDLFSRLRKLEKRMDER